VAGWNGRRPGPCWSEAVSRQRFDIIYAFVLSAMSDISPERVLQSVASGLLGSSAFEGGAPAAALGLVAHFTILFVAAALSWQRAVAGRGCASARSRAGCCSVSAYTS